MAGGGFHLSFHRPATSSHRSSLSLALYGCWSFSLLPRSLAPLAATASFCSTWHIFRRLLCRCKDDGGRRRRRRRSHDRERERVRERGGAERGKKVVEKVERTERPWKGHRARSHPDNADNGKIQARRMICFFVKSKAADDSRSIRTAARTVRDDRYSFFLLACLCFLVFFIVFSTFSRSI